MNNIEELKEKVYNYFKQHGYTIIEINNNESIVNIHNLITNNTAIEDNNDMTYLYYGNYYKNCEDYDNMLKYYLMGIELGDTTAMYNLAYHYQDQKDYDNMLKYYLMGIKLSDTDAMYGLACHYRDQKDYSNMIKYYLMAIDLNESVAMNQLAAYYQKNQDYDNMIKYYQMSIDLDDAGGMIQLGNYYETQDDFANMIKYYEMAAKHENNYAIAKLRHYFESQNDYKNAFKYCLMELNNTTIPSTYKIESYLKKDYQLFLSTHKDIPNIDIPEIIIHHIHNNYTPELLEIILNIESDNKVLNLIKTLLQEKIDIMDLHFSYSMEGKGFNDAKQDFFNRIC